MPLSKHRQSRTQLHRLHQNRTHAVGRGCTVMLYCTVLAIVLIPIAEYMVGSTFRESEPATPRAVSGAEPDELHPQMHFRGNTGTDSSTTPMLMKEDTNTTQTVPTGVDTGDVTSSNSGSFRTLTRVNDGACLKKDCRMLVTGCGRSGTHFVAEILSQAGIPILHEKIGEVGTVSWVHAAPFRKDLAELEEWFSDKASVELRASPDFQFFPVFHLVRHPLAAISSLTECFCGCGSMSCGGWADPPSWKMAGKSIEFSNQYCSRMENNEVCAKHYHGNGRLIRSMEYWLRWNHLAGSQAHFRLQLETVDVEANWVACNAWCRQDSGCIFHHEKLSLMDLSEVIDAAPQLLGSSANAQDAIARSRLEKASFVSKRARRKTWKPVTWEWMRAADASLEARIWELAQTYGYSRDPP